MCLLLASQQCPPSPTSCFQLVQLPRRFFDHWAAGTAKLPVFWGYCLAVGLLGVGAALIREARLAVVFDIDETLLQAHSLSSLKSAVSKCKDAR